MSNLPTSEDGKKLAALFQEEIKGLEKKIDALAKKLEGEKKTTK